MDEGFKNTTARAKGHESAKTAKAATIIITIMAAVLFGIGGFVGGMQYQKSKAGATGTMDARMQAGQAGFGAMSGGIGTVSAVSATSITITEQRQNSTKTYTIDSGTKILKDASSATVSDITTGDRVLIQTAGTTSTVATQIEINPTMPSGGPAGSGTSNGTPPTNTQTN